MLHPLYILKATPEVSGRNVRDDFNFDSYLMREIELTLLKYFNASSGLFLGEKLIPEKRLTMNGKSRRRDYELHAHIHQFIVMI